MSDLQHTLYEVKYPEECIASIDIKYQAPRLSVLVIFIQKTFFMKILNLAHFHNTYTTSWKIDKRQRSSRCYLQNAFKISSLDRYEN